MSDLREKRAAYQKAKDYIHLNIEETAKPELYFAYFFKAGWEAAKKALRRDTPETGES